MRLVTCLLLSLFLSATVDIKAQRLCVLDPVSTHTLDPHHGSELPHMLNMLNGLKMAGRQRNETETKKMSALLGEQPPGDPIADNFFLPELVMQHQNEIGLSEDQKSFLKSEIRKTQLRFTELQWQLQDEAEKMVALVKEPRVDEGKSIAHLEKVLDIEREIKRLQMTLAIRIKNSLSPEQQTRLNEIKTKSRSLVR